MGRGVPPSIPLHPLFIVFSSPEKRFRSISMSQRHYPRDVALPSPPHLFFSYHPSPSFFCVSLSLPNFDIFHIFPEYPFFSNPCSVLEIWFASTAPPPPPLMMSYSGKFPSPIDGTGRGVYSRISNLRSAPPLLFFLKIWTTIGNLRIQPPASPWSMGLEKIRGNMWKIWRSMRKYEGRLKEYRENMKKYEENIEEYEEIWRQYEELWRLTSEHAENMKEYEEVCGKMN